MALDLNAVQPRGRKYIAARGVVLRLSADSVLTTDPVLHAGAGAPADDDGLPDGSIYARTDGGVSTGLYIKTGEAYSPLPADGNDFGAPGLETDVIAESTAAAGVTVDGLLIKDGAVRGLQTVSSSAAAIITTRVLTLADAGGVFNVDQDAAFDIDVPDPTTGPGCRYTFVITDAGANNVTITCAGAATFVGTITIDGATIPATGSTLTFATGAAVVGDSIEMISLSTALYFARCISSGAGGITIA
jgi:hypothetical protein